jgi:hypothetical protein
VHWCYWSAGSCGVDALMHSTHAAVDTTTRTASPAGCQHVHNLPVPFLFAPICTRDLQQYKAVVVNNAGLEAYSLAGSRLLTFRNMHGSVCIVLSPCHLDNLSRSLEPPCRAQWGLVPRQTQRRAPHSCRSYMHICFNLLPDIMTNLCSPPLITPSRSRGPMVPLGLPV